MSQRVQIYQRLRARLSLVVRAEDKDDILDEMDSLWFEMNDAERELLHMGNLDD